MERKVWVVAYRGAMVGIYTNRTKVWDALLEAYQTTQEQIKAGERSLRGEIVVGGDWRQRNTCNLQPVKILSPSSLSRIFMKSENLYLWDESDKEEYVTVQMTYLNDTQLPSLNPDWE